MEVTKGKLKNLVSGKELVFESNPAQYEMTQGFDFALEPRLGKSAPAIAFRCGEGATLSCEIHFDPDLGVSENGIQEAMEFISAINKVDEETLSVPCVELTLGGLRFKGYVRRYRFRAYRFNSKGETTGASLALELLSDGSFEQEEA